MVFLTFCKFYGLEKGVPDNHQAGSTLAVVTEFILQNQYCLYSL